MHWTIIIQFQADRQAFDENLTAKNGAVRLRIISGRTRPISDAHVAIGIARRGIIKFVFAAQLTA